MDEIKQLGKDTRMLLAVLLDQYKILKDGKVEVTDVCEAWDGAMQMYAEETERRVRQEMQQEIRQEVQQEIRQKIQREAAIEKEQAVNTALRKAEKLVEKFQKLLFILSTEQKYDELQKALTDKEYCQKLYSIYKV